MLIIIIILVVVAIAGSVAIGYGVGKGQNPPSVPSPAGGSNDSNCSSACTRWDNARQQQCNAKTDEAAARARADGIRSLMLGFLAAAVALSVAGAAALGAAAVATATIFGIPAGVVLTGIAIGLFVLAAAATASAAYFAGQLIAAEADAGAKAAARQAWDTEVAKARAEVNAKCPSSEANACLSRTGPC